MAANIGAKREALKYAKKEAEKGEYLNAFLIAKESNAEKEVEEYRKKLKEK